jgi:glycosyltransferase involved in cell wall biosynthesis
MNTAATQPETPQTVSVVIPCLNAAETLPALVDALLRQKLPAGTGLEIVIVDNGSTDASPRVAAGLPVTRITESRPGAAAARNAGVRASRGSVIVFLDADTRPADDRLIAEHLATLAASPTTGIAGGAITHDPEQSGLLPFAENATGLFNWHNRLPARSLTFQPTGNMAFRRTLFDAVGPLDESLLWLEDFEFNARVRRAGYEIRFNPKAGVYIRGRESFGAIMRKFYRWGLNVRRVYVPGRRDQFWLFPDHPRFFRLNGPLRALNETWVTVKRWFPVYPVRTLLLVPLFLMFRSAWAWGMMAGASGPRNGNTHPPKGATP